MNARELEFFKDILEERKKQILKNIGALDDELEQLSSCELNDEGDYASVCNDTMIEGVIGHNQLQKLQEINSAISKIVSGNGEYGTCEMCGDDIGIARLKVKPHALYCIHCREYIDKSESKIKSKRLYA